MERFFGVGILFVFIFGSSNSSWDVEKKYPSRPIDLVVGYPPGGLADTNTRLLAKYLEKYFGVSVVTVNKPGAGAVVGTTYVANARPDGYTIGSFFDHVVIAILLGHATYSLQDFRAIGRYYAGNKIYFRACWF